MMTATSKHAFANTSDKRSVILRCSPPLPEPRLPALGGGAGGRCLSSNGGKLFEHSEFFRRPLKVVGLGVSTEAGRAFFGSFLCTSKERNALPGAPGLTPWPYVAEADQRASYRNRR
jgi:hypothetical protein